MERAPSALHIYNRRNGHQNNWEGAGERENGHRRLCCCCCCCCILVYSSLSFSWLSIHLLPLPHWVDIVFIKKTKLLQYYYYSYLVFTPRTSRSSSILSPFSSLNTYTATVQTLSLSPSFPASSSVPLLLFVFLFFSCFFFHCFQGWKAPDVVWCSMCAIPVVLEERGDSACPSHLCAARFRSGQKKNGARVIKSSGCDL